MEPYDDLRGWLERCREIGEVVDIEGADPHLEVGALTEHAYREFSGGPALLFDQLKGYPRGYRVLTNQLTSLARVALTLNVPVLHGKMEFVRFLRQHVKSVGLRPTREVADGPVLQNVREGPGVDLSLFPAPHWHPRDGGRYLGTGSLTITRDPDTGCINVGTYRAMVHGPDRLGLYISQIKHGRRHLERYWERGQACPVVLCFGQDPLLFVASSMSLPAAVNELEYVGGVRGRPVDVLRGEHTGLPIPASAEIAVEGEIDPVERQEEGPFGEWAGYYASGTRPEPVVRVKRLLFRDDPIITGAPPFRPPNADTFYRPLFKSGLIWDDLEAAGVPDVRGVWTDEAGGGNLLVVVSIKQRYPGHARQAAHIASQCGAAITLARYVVVVDDDIDPSNREEVLWAICTRTDPEQSIEIMRRCFSNALDPAITPAHNRMHSRAIIDACKPFERIGTFPVEIAQDPAVLERVKEKWGPFLTRPRIEV